jgi:hypothetical protein
VNELSNIRSNNLTFHKEHVDIFIIKSKTDCYRNGKNVFIAISLALVYGSFSFFFLRINVLDFLRNEIDLNKNTSESKSIPAREM